jgi:FkbM family methyltransferase
MNLYTKERNGDQRIITIFGLRFTYTKIRSFQSRGRRDASPFDLMLDKVRIATKYRGAFESITGQDVCIDCGCNAGNVAEVFLHKGAFVYAFEPHPYLFEILSKKYRQKSSIIIFNKAVWDKNTRMDIHVQKVKGSEALNLEGTTLFGERIDARVESKGSVEVIDLTEFITALNKRVKILKIDVEGAEFEIIEKIISTGLYEKIDHIFCETHPHFFPNGAGRLASLEDKIRRKCIKNIHLDWV